MVAGLSVGLVSKQGEGAGVAEYLLLKDILGSEDHHGDMDFKIAGSVAGVTAMQLDVKLVGGVPLSVLADALDLAREGRLQILDIMHRSSSGSSSTNREEGSNLGYKIDSRRRKMKPFAPKAEIIQCDEERRAKLIGSGGEMIKSIRDMFSCDIELDINGQVYIYGKDPKLVAEAVRLVRDVAVAVKEVGIL